MLNFYTKKKILKRLSECSEKNFLMVLPCMIAAVCVKLFYFAACNIDIALSDRDGNFLGIKRKQKVNAPSKVKQDDIVYVKKSPAGRIVSVVLAFAFAFMTVPASEITVFAADGYTQLSGSSYYYKDSDWTTLKIAEKNFVNGYGSARVFWELITGKPGSYIITKVNNANGVEEIMSDVWKSTTYTYTGLSPSTSYTYRIQAKKTISLYNLIPKDPSADPPRLTDQYEKVTTYDILSNEIEFNAGTPNVAIDTPVLNDIEYDGNVTATLRWTPVTQRGSDVDAEGYVIFRRTINNKTSTATKFTQIGSIRAASPGAIDANGLFTYSDTVVQGTVYEYYVMAYSDVFGDTSGQYIPNSAGIITSASEENAVKKRIATTPTSPKNLKVTSNKKDTLNLTWAAGSGNNNGYIIFRSDVELKEAEAYAAGYSDFSKYIIDKAALLDEVSDSTKSYADKDSSLINDHTYWYYVISYIIQDTSGTRLYSVPAKASGSISSSLTTPQGFTAVPGDGQVVLSWDQVAGADGYKLYITKVSSYDGSTTGVGVTNVVYVTKNTYTHVGLFNGDVYSYQVRAYINTTTNPDPTVEDYDKLLSDYSDKRTVTVGLELGTPQDMKATTKEGTVTVSWSAVSGAEGYTLYYSKNSGAYQHVEVTKPTFNHTGLNIGDRYSYYVVPYKTVNGVRVVGNSSVIISIIVGDSIDAPKDLTATASDGKIDLKWTTVKGAEGYIVYATSGGVTTNFNVSKGTFSHTGLTTGSVWSYYVVAYKTVNGERFYSEPSATVTATAGIFLSAPADFAVKTNDASATLTWTAVKGSEGYTVYAYKSGTSLQFDVSKPTFTHTGLNNGETWNYYVRAYKTVNGERVYSDPTITLSIKIGAALSAPIDLIAVSGNRQVDLKWSKVNGAEGYIVYLYDDASESFLPLTAVSKTQYSHTGLKNGTKYTYMVAAYKTLNGEQVIGDYSMAVWAIPSSGSAGDIDTTLNIKGTAPYGISHSELISAAANHDAFDESVDIYFSVNSESTKAVKEVLKHYANGLSSFIIYPFDISAYIADTLVSVEPNDGYSVTFTMPVPDKLIRYRDYITVIHIPTDGTQIIYDDDIDNVFVSATDLEVLPSAIIQINGHWCIQFTASSFSPFALVIYKDNISDISSGAASEAGSFAGTFNTGMLLFTVTPDIMPQEKKTKFVVSTKKYYRIKK